MANRGILVAVSGRVVVLPIGETHVVIDERAIANAPALCVKKKGNVFSREFLVMIRQEQRKSLKPPPFATRNLTN